MKIIRTCSAFCQNIFFANRLTLRCGARILNSPYIRGMRGGRDTLHSTGEVVMRKLCSAIAFLSIGFALGGSQLAIAQTPFYKQTNLISDDKSVIDAKFEDSFVVNAWGLTSSPTSPWWIANNGSGTSTLYNAATNTIPSLVVSIPGGKPTGAVWNSAGSGTFVVTNGVASGSAVFIFSSEAGIISGWNPNVPAAGSTQAQVGATVADAIYEGLAIAGTGTGARLFAT